MSDQAYIEKRQAERVTAHFEVSFHEVAAPDVERLMRSGSGDYKDITAPQAPANARAVKDVMSVVTENISVGGIKIVGAKPFKEGATLDLEMKIPGLPLPIKALAVVIRNEIVQSHAGKFSAGVRFIAINKADIAKIDRYVAMQRRAEIERKAMGG